MEIRRMRNGEESSAYSLMGSVLDEYFAPEVVSYFMMQWPNGQIAAFDFLGNMVGYLAGSRLQNGRVSIALFCVDRAFQGKGIGTMMFNQFRQAAMMEGYSVIQLEVKESNRAAYEFYRRKGFVPVERLESFYNDGSAGIRMVLETNFQCRNISRLS